MLCMRISPSLAVLIQWASKNIRVFAMDVWVLNYVDPDVNDSALFHALLSLSLSLSLSCILIHNTHMAMNAHTTDILYNSRLLNFVNIHLFHDDDNLIALEKVSYSMNILDVYCLD